MDAEVEAVIDEIRERVEPTARDRESLGSVIDTLLGRTRDAVSKLDLEADVIHVGSTARDTWLTGDRDIDIFVRFPPELGREDLEADGLAVGQAVLPDPQEEYAEHPYVSGEFQGFDVDVVPCYDVETPADIRSAVDRTPFHAQYVSERLTPALASDVRVCKQLFSGIGVYGSNLRTRGFSGFLTELLVLEHDGFAPLVETATDWQPPVHIDPEEHGSATFDDPLIVIDPTDPERNVAAVLSETNLARFQHFARSLLADPRTSVFEPPRRTPLDADAVLTHFDERGTTPIAVCFDAPDVVDDQLWPQLERSRTGIATELDRRGFDVFRSATFVDDDTGRAALLFELTVAELPAVERHDGPPVSVGDHATSFFEKYEDEEVYGPFIRDNRYVVERPRAVTGAIAFCESDRLLDVAHGVTIEAALREGYEVLANEAVGSLASHFGVQLARYLSPSPRGN